MVTAVIVQSGRFSTSFCFNRSHPEHVSRWLVHSDPACPPFGPHASACSLSLENTESQTKEDPQECAGLKVNQHVLKNTLVTCTRPQQIHYIIVAYSS